MRYCQSYFFKRGRGRGWSKDPYYTESVNPNPSLRSQLTNVNLLNVQYYRLSYFTKSEVNKFFSQAEYGPLRMCPLFHAVLRASTTMTKSCTCSWSYINQEGSIASPSSCSLFKYASESEMEYLEVSSIHLKVISSKCSRKQTTSGNISQERKN